MKKLIFLGIMVLLAFSGCSGKSGQSNGNRFVPEGWYVSSSNVKVRYQKLKEDDPSYKIDFERTWQDEEEKYYLTLAESLYPSREFIESTRASLAKPPKTDPAWYFERVWWGYVHEDKKIPFAITSEGILEYLDYYKQFKEQIDLKRKDLNLVGDNRNRIDFKYKANVTTSGSQVRVDLYMHWYQYCGLPCGWGFEKRRTITFQSRGVISGVEGDSFPTLWKSSEEDPYGKEWFTF